MSKKKKSGKKKVVVTTKNQSGKRVVSKSTEPVKKKKLSPTASKLKQSGSAQSPQTATAFIFNRNNYLLMIGGIALMALGFILMLGGNMPNPDVWEPDRIYSFRRITLAPILILAGLGLEVFAIFKKS